MALICREHKARDHSKPSLSSSELRESSSVVSDLVRANKSSLWGELQQQRKRDSTRGLLTNNMRMELLLPVAMV